MGSVISDTECPNCKDPHAYYDCNYKSGDQIIICDMCGYYYSREIAFNEDLTKSDYIEKEIANPFGYLIMIYESGGGSGTPLETEQEYLNILEDIDKEINTERIKKIHLNRYIDGKYISKKIFDKVSYFRKKKLQKLSL